MHLFIEFKALKTIRELYYYSFYENSDRFSDCQYIVNSYIENLARSKKNYLKIKNVLKEIKKHVLKEKSDVFYINQSIVYVEKIYVDSFSKEFSFEEAYREIKKLKV